MVPLQFQVKYDFLIRGIDGEDISFLKRSYEELLQSVSENSRVVNDERLSYWLNGTHWVNHSHTLIPDPQPPKKRRKHVQDDLPSPHKTGTSCNVQFHADPEKPEVHSVHLLNSASRCPTVTTRLWKNGRLLQDQSSGQIVSASSETGDG